MSLKLAHGIRFTTPHLLDINNLFMEFRDEVELVVRVAMTDKMAAEMSADFDNRLINPPKEGEKAESLYWKVMDRFRKGRDLSEAGRHSQYDYDLSVSLLPFEGQVYGLVFSEQRILLDLVAQQPWIEPYGFWDNTDKDDDMDADEWEERRRVWNGIFVKRYSPPAHLGLTAECNFTDKFWPGAEELLAAMPDVETRLRKLSYKKVADVDFSARMREKVAVKRAEAEAEGKEPTPPHLFAVSTFFETENWIKTEAGQVALAAARAELEPLIKPHTKEDFAS